MGTFSSSPKGDIIKESRHRRTLDFKFEPGSLACARVADAPKSSGALAAATHEQPRCWAWLREMVYAAVHGGDGRGQRALCRWPLPGAEPVSAPARGRGRSRRRSSRSSKTRSGRTAGETEMWRCRQRGDFRGLVKRPGVRRDRGGDGGSLGVALSVRQLPAGTGG